jgi:polyhydroxyalkanoate synthesis regulator phasin
LKNEEFNNQHARFPYRGECMLEVIKKSILAGIGALALTEEKVQEVIDEFVQKGQITQKEGESLVNEIQKVIDDHKAKLTTMIDEHVKSLLDGLNLVTKNDLAEMEKNLRKDFAKVEKQLAKLEKQMKTSHNESDD